MFIIGGSKVVAQQPDSTITEPAIILTDSLTVIGDTLTGDSLVKSRTKGVISTNINYEARDSIDNDVVNKRVYLYGNAKITYDDIVLTADRIVYDFESFTVHAEGIQDTLGNWQGLPVFEQRGTSFEAREMDYNFKSKKAYVKQVQTEIIEGTLTGKRVKTVEDNRVIYVSKAEYCPCEDPNAKTRFKINRLKLIKDDKIISGPGYLTLWNVPMPLAFPFGFFPDAEKEQAGLIIPSYGNAPGLGFFLTDGGYYLPINQYLDTKFLGDIYSRGSFGLSNITRYKKQYKFNGSTSVEYNVIKTGDRDLQNFSGAKNFFVVWNHTQDRKARPYSNFGAQVNAGSTQNFTNNINASQTDYLTNTFRSNIRFDQRFPNSPWSLAANASHQQNSQTGIYNFTLPQLTANQARIFPLDGLFNNNPKQAFYEKIGFTFGTDFQNTLTVAETDLALNNLNNLLDEFQFGFRHNAALNTSLKAGKFSINPSLTYNERWHFEEQGRTFDNQQQEYIVDTLYGFNRNYDYGFNVQATTKIYGMFTFQSGNLKAIRHTITPSFGYSFRPDFDPNVYGFYGTDGNLGSYSPYTGTVYGGPPSGRSESITLSILNSLEGKILSRRDTTAKFSKIKLIENLQFSTAYNLAADSLKLRPIAMSGRTPITKYANINFNALFDPYSYAVNSTGMLNRQDVFLVERTGKLASFETGSLQLNTSGFGSNTFKRNKGSEPMVVIEGDEFSDQPLIQPKKGIFTDFSIPWNVTLGYVINTSRGRRVENFDDLFVIRDSVSVTTQSLQFNGDLSFFNRVTMRFNSGYDFKQKEWTPTTLNFVVDLNCWELTARVVPFGIRRSYSVSLNIKSSLLRDLKLERNRTFDDNQARF